MKEFWISMIFLGGMEKKQKEKVHHMYCYYIDINNIVL